MVIIIIIIFVYCVLKTGFNTNKKSLQVPRDQGNETAEAACDGVCNCHNGSLLYLLACAD